MTLWGDWGHMMWFKMSSLLLVAVRLDQIHQQAGPCWPTTHVYTLGNPSPKSAKLQWRRWRRAQSLFHRTSCPWIWPDTFWKLEQIKQTYAINRQMRQLKYTHTHAHTAQHNTNESKHYHFYFLNFHKVNELQISAGRWSLLAGIEKTTIRLSIREY